MFWVFFLAAFVRVSRDRSVCVRFCFSFRILVFVCPRMKECATASRPPLLSSSLGRLRFSVQNDVCAV